MLQILALVEHCFQSCMCIGQELFLKYPFALVNRCSCRVFKHSKGILVAVLMLGYAGCSSTSPIKTQYYLLNANPESKIKERLSVRITEDQLYPQSIKLKQLILSDYLKQKSLAVLDKTHQLYYANHHLWAEPLQSSIENALSEDFSQLTEFNFIKPLSPLINQADYELTIDIQHFVTTQDGRVVLSGYYYLLAEDNNKMNQYDFFIEKKLIEDGYAHSVQLQRLLIRELALMIDSTLTNNSK